MATPKSGRCYAAISMPDYATSAGRQEAASTPLPIPLPVLSSRLAADTGCGSPQTPWIVEVPPGQRVNLTLVDFTSTSTASSNVTARYGSCRLSRDLLSTELNKMESRRCRDRLYTKHMIACRIGLYKYKFSSAISESER